MDDRKKQICLAGAVPLGRAGVREADVGAAPAIGFGTFIVSAPTPFRPEDCAELIRDAPAVVARYFPDYPALYRRRGWSMFGWIDRIYLSARAEAVLGFRCRTGFAEVLAALDAQEGMVNPPLAPAASISA